MARQTTRDVPHKAHDIQQPICPTCVVLHSIGSSFGKHLPGAALVPTPKPTNFDAYPDGATLPRQIMHGAHVAAVKGPGNALAGRATWNMIKMYIQLKGISDAINGIKHQQIVAGKRGL